MIDPTNPLIVQGDLTVLLDVAAPRADGAREQLARFAELVSAPEHIHTYRITPLSLWNAAVAGLDADDVIDHLTDHTKYPVPASVLTEVNDQMSRYGRMWLTRDAGDGLVLATDDPVLLHEVGQDRVAAELLGRRLDDHRIAVADRDRGALKQALLQIGWPVADEAGFEQGSALDGVRLIADLRPYQTDALRRWWRDGGADGGSGVVTLPCGAGKTIVGLAAIATAGTHTLVVCASVTSIRQWIGEVLDKTDISRDDVGEWSGRRKELRPLTFVTYHALTHVDRDADVDGDLFERHPNLRLFDEQRWGLIVYDEVHLLPAPIFRATARLQAVRRLGLTATLVREDGREGDIFSLIGPKRYDVPWHQLEAQGWIATASCTEIRVQLRPDTRMTYATTDTRRRHRVAATATEKLTVLDELVQRHRGDQILVIGQFVGQLRQVAARLEAPLLTGQSSQKTRDRWFAAMRDGELDVLVVSKIANFAVDLPEVTVAIQLSGQFGSRQEEAQRLGRILRPKSDGRPAVFYTVIAADTDEVAFARNRQRFLAEQGYAYAIVDHVSSACRERSDHSRHG